MTVWKTLPMLILASTSDTRKTLLRQAGLSFLACPAGIDERAIQAAAVSAGADGREVALRLAIAKAEAVSEDHPAALVIGADQTLSLGAELLHKPPTLADAAAQLDKLRGKTHRLHAGVALVRNGQNLWSDVQTAELTMRHFSQQERDEVLKMEGARVLASVGSYRLEGPSIRFFQSVTGDYFTILGLPLLPLLGALRDIASDLLQPGPAS